MGEADGVYVPVGNSPLYVRGECKGTPRGFRPCRASHRDYVVIPIMGWSVSVVEEN